MNSIKVFDDVICYLEKVIHEGSEIDYDEISKIAMSPVALFQRIFVFVSGISISEYVRKRRLTLAGHDLKDKDASILDIALKYGFQSHSAFARAFKEHHGITPSAAQCETLKLEDFLPINFSEMRFIGGKRIMAEMKKIIYKEVDERLIVGLHRITSFSEAGGVWQDFFKSDTVPKLNTLSNFKQCEDINENDGIGFMYDFEGMDNFNIIIGDFVKTGTEIPDGLFSKYIPKGLTAQVQIEGNNIADILNSAYLLITEAIEKTDKQIDFDNFYWCEVYTHDRYCKPLKQGKKVILDYIMPVKGTSNHE